MRGARSDMLGVMRKQRRYLPTLAFVLAAVATALAQGQKPAPPAAPAYDAKFVVGPNSTVYSGATTFKVDDKGVVTGAMNLTAPVVVTGTLSGPVKDGTWAVQINYAIPDQACEGLVSGTAKVPADLKEITGTVRVTGGCTPDPLEGTFTFTKR